MIDWDSLGKAAGLAGGKELLEKTYLSEKASITALASKFGCGTNTIRAALAKYGIATRSRGGANFQKVTLDEGMLAELRSNGVIATAVARGVDPSAIYKALRRENITLRGEQPAEPAKESEPGGSGSEDS